MYETHPTILQIVDNIYWLEIDSCWGLFWLMTHLCLSQREFQLLSCCMVVGTSCWLTFQCYKSSFDDDLIDDYSPCAGFSYTWPAAPLEVGPLAASWTMWRSMPDSALEQHFNYSSMLAYWLQCSAVVLSRIYLEDMLVEGLWTFQSLEPKQIWKIPMGIWLTVWQSK